MYKNLCANLCANLCGALALSSATPWNLPASHCTRSLRVGFAALVGLLATLFPPFASTAQPPRGWLTGAPLQQHLRSEISITWSGVPLRDGLASLTRSAHLPIYLDRRVDPNRTLDLTLENVPLGEALPRIAESQEIGFCWIRSLAWFGPDESVLDLPTLLALARDEVRHLPRAEQRTWLAERPWQWDDFATPRDLLAAELDTVGARLAGLEQVPHDLWPAANLPPLTLLERVFLVAVQFDLTLQFDEVQRCLALVPRPREVAIERDYLGGPNAPAVVERWQQRVPDARFEIVDGHAIRVRGRFEDHQQLLRAGARATAGRNN